MAEALLNLKDEIAFPDGAKSYEATLSDAERQLLDEFIQYKSITLNPQKLLDVRRAVLNLRHVVGKPITADFDIGDVKQFLRVLYSSDRAAETKKSTGEHLFTGYRSFLKWRFKDWSVRFNNFADEGGGKLVRWKVKPLAHRITENDLLTEDEVRRLCLACAHFKERAIVALHGCTPARTKEIRDLRWQDVLFDQGRIRVHDTKMGKSREMPVDAVTLEILKRWHEQYRIGSRAAWKAINPRDWPPLPSWFVFPSYDSPEKPITSGAVWRMYKRASKAAGITKNVYGYLNRHSVISRYQKSGVDIRDVANVAGHSSITTTLGYTHLSQSHSIGQVVKRVFEAEQLPKVERPRISKSEPSVQEQIAELRSQLARILAAAENLQRSPE